MSERKYTVSEIDNLRRVVEYKWLFGRYSPVGDFNSSRCFKASEKDVAVEQQVRTYMLAGLTAEDMVASEKSIDDVSA